MRRWIGRTHGIVPSRQGTRETSLAMLDHVQAVPWNRGRAAECLARAQEGTEAPAITVVYWADGTAQIDDGNHRLWAARQLDVTSIRVRWVRGAGRTAPPPLALSAAA
jgi:hypothetical protein